MRHSKISSREMLGLPKFRFAELEVTLPPSMGSIQRGKEQLARRLSQQFQACRELILLPVVFFSPFFRASVFQSFPLIYPPVRSFVTRARIDEPAIHLCKFVPCHGDIIVDDAYHRSRFNELLRTAVCTRTVNSRRIRAITSSAAPPI